VTNRLARPLMRLVSRSTGLLVLSVGLAGLLWASQLWAAVPVEDMSTRDIRPSEPVPGAVSAPSSTPNPGVVTGFGGQNAGVQGSVGGNAQLFYELQALQSEVQQLRGLVEDQAYEISRLRDLQRSQYLDIDRRLTEDGHSVSHLPGATQAPQRATTGAPNGVPAPSAPPASPSSTRDAGGGLQVPVPVVQTATAQAPQASAPGQRLVPDVALETPGVPALETSAAVSAARIATPSAARPASTSRGTTSHNEAGEGGITQPASPPGSEPAPSEKLAFERAFELMKEQQFEQSITAYQQIVEGYPDGDYAPESRYWLGELYLMADQLEAARGSFVSVVEVYPAHKKVPLSLYKLGVVNHRLGATPQALEYLDSVVTRYPDTPAAGLARTYAAELR